MIALAIEKHNLHKRIALNIISLLGDNPRRLVLGFMIATAVLSMWISNTATTMMMLPIGISVILQARESKAKKQFVDKFALVLMLSIAYSASIGGIGTLIGTPPNISFSKIFAETFPNAPEITFAQWMLVGVPLVIVFIGIAWFSITFLITPLGKKGFLGRGVIAEEKRNLGKMRPSEKRVLVIFILTALLWMFRKNIYLGGITIPGWSNLAGLDKLVDDGTVAIGMSLLLFLIPSGDSVKQPLLDWNTAKRLPWGILLLFGGGFALAEGFKTSGLSAYIGGSLSGLSNTSPIVAIIVVSVLMTFLTEITSNTATTQMILPILASVSMAIGENPLLLMIPATISASCAFMLPVATPPNAIIFGSGYVPMMKMVKTGIWLNLIGVAIVFLAVYFIGIPVFHINISTIPTWAK